MEPPKSEEYGSQEHSGSKVMSPSLALGEKNQIVMTSDQQKIVMGQIKFTKAKVTQLPLKNV